MFSSLKFKFVIYTILLDVSLFLLVYFGFIIYKPALFSNASFIRIAFIIFAIFTIISAVIVYYVARHISEPIKDLTNTVDDITDGDFEDFRLNYMPNNEIGKLGEAISKMAATVYGSVESSKSEKNKLEALLMHITDGIISFNLDGAIMQINSAAQKMLGLDDDENINFDEFFGEKLQLDIAMARLLYFETEGSIVRDCKLDEKALKIRFVTFKNEQNKLSGIITIIHDITEIEKVAELRHEFVANVSHELNTPLTNIKGYAEALIDDVSNKQKRFLEVIISEVDRLSRMSKDLLTLSSLSNSSVAKEYVELDAIIKTVVNTFLVQAKKSGQTLTYSSSSSPVIYANPDKIKQVLVNIIGNALKYSPDGTGEVQVFAGEFRNSAYIKVQDNGFGISAKEIPRIFERFYRIDKARSRAKGGTGLGLAIAKEIIKLHDGDIEVKSKVGSGTKITILLPLG